MICFFLYKFEYISVGIVESKKRMERKPFSLLEYVLSTLRLSPKRKEVKSDAKLM